MSNLLLHSHPRVAPPRLGAEIGPASPPGARPGWLSLVMIGAVGGTSSGLFAIGGGVFMVPLIMWRWGMDQRHAAALALATLVPSSLIGSLTYLAHGQVDLTAAAVVATGSTAGAVLGSRLLQRVPVDRLRWLFVVFVLLVALRLVLVPPVRSGHDVDFTVATACSLLAVGLVVGVLAGLFGIGGGIIAVPLLVSLLAVSDLVAKGTSLLVSVPTSAVGTATNQRSGLVNLRTGLALGSVATATSVPAAVLALAMPPRVSGLLLAALLVVVAGQTAAKAVGAHRAGRTW